jgi:hypothetical protein
MFNKILLVCLLLAHLQITAFAMETEERPTESWFRLFPYNKVTPEINDQNLVQLRITQRPEVEEVKKCSFSYIFQILFKPTKKMATGNSAISLSTTETRYSDARLDEDTSNPPEISDHISIFGEEKLETEESTCKWQSNNAPCKGGALGQMAK